jgi:hypothetical protein
VRTACGTGLFLWHKEENEMPVDAQTLQAIGNLGAVPLLGILLWQAIKIRKNGNGNLRKLEEKLDTTNERIYGLAQSIARIEGHLNINE